MVEGASPKKEEGCRLTRLLQVRCSIVVWSKGVSRGIIGIKQMNSVMQTFGRERGLYIDIVCNLEKQIYKWGSVSNVILLIELLIVIWGFSTPIEFG